MTRTVVNICTVNNGNAAATADRTRVLTANAEALYMLVEELQTFVRLDLGIKTYR